MKTEEQLMESIKTFEDAQQATGRLDVPDFSNVPADMRRFFEATYKLAVIAEALNSGWQPNWNNEDEYKYRPWFYMSPSGFAFNYSSDDFTIAFGGGGSRLCCRTRKLSDYFGQQFLPLWKELMLK